MEGIDKSTELHQNPCEQMFGHGVLYKKETNKHPGPLNNSVLEGKVECIIS